MSEVVRKRPNLANGERGQAAPAVTKAASDEPSWSVLQQSLGNAAVGRLVELRSLTPSGAVIQREPAPAGPSPAAEPEGPPLPAAKWVEAVKSRAPAGEEANYVSYISKGAGMLQSKGYANATGALVGAIIDSEAAQVKGVWQANSKAAGSSALGLTQFLSGSWQEMNKPGTALGEKVASEENQFAEEKAAFEASGQLGPIDSRGFDEKGSMTKEGVLGLRTDAETSILTAIDYAITNLSDGKYRELIKATEGVEVTKLGEADLFKYVYFAHHEGVGGARTLLEVLGGDTDATDFVTASKWTGNLSAANQLEYLKAEGMDEEGLGDTDKATYETLEAEIAELTTEVDEDTAELATQKTTFQAEIDALKEKQKGELAAVKGDKAKTVALKKTQKAEMAALTKRQKTERDKLIADKATAAKGVKTKNEAQDALLTKFSNASLSPENQATFNSAYAKWLQGYAEARTKGWLD